jgi:predicted dehydrogenase
VVAIAEPRPKTRKRFAAKHGVDKTLVFDTWQDLHGASAETIKTIGARLADAVIIAVQDHMHAQAVSAFAQQGYHILCEKPMATSVEDCIMMENAVRKADIIFGMGHGERLPLIEPHFSKCLVSVAVFALYPRDHGNYSVRQPGSVGQHSAY